MILLLGTRWKVETDESGGEDEQRELPLPRATHRDVSSWFCNLRPACFAACSFAVLPLTYIGNVQEALIFGVWYASTSFTWMYSTRGNR